MFIHNEVRDFDKNSTQPEIRVNRIRDNESQLYYKRPFFHLPKSPIVGIIKDLFSTYPNLSL